MVQNMIIDLIFLFFSLLQDFTVVVNGHLDMNVK